MQQRFHGCSSPWHTGSGFDHPSASGGFGVSLKAAAQTIRRGLAGCRFEFRRAGSSNVWACCHFGCCPWQVCCQRVCRSPGDPSTQRPALFLRSVSAALGTRHLNHLRSWCPWPVRWPRLVICYDPLWLCSSSVISSKEVNWPNALTQIYLQAQRWIIHSPSRSFKNSWQAAASSRQ